MFGANQTANIFPPMSFENTVFRKISLAEFPNHGNAPPLSP
jgi:hypothetical protein